MELSIVLSNPVTAHQQIAQSWNSVKPELVAGNRHILEIRPYGDHLTDRQRKYLHGYVYMEIARQANIDGKTYPMQVWKEHFRKTFLGEKRKTCTNPLTGRKSKRSVRVSTEDLGVRGYATLIEKVTAFAVTELGVVFDVSMDEFVDQETGEILTRGGR